MALVKATKTLAPKLFLRNAVLKTISIRNYADLPGPHDKPDYPYLWIAEKKIPKTPEEIEEAAKKYNLHPKEYKSYEEDDGYGDYPKLPFIGSAARDPNYPYDFPAIRRNFGEPVHIEADQMGEDRYDAGVKQMVTTKAVIFMVFGTVFGYWTLTEIFEHFPWFQCVMEKQYPQPGVTHYTFQPLR